MLPIIPTRRPLEILNKLPLSDEQKEICDFANRVAESFSDTGTAEMHYIKKLVAAGFLIKTRSRKEPYQFTEAASLLVALWNAIECAKASLTASPQPDRESEITEDMIDRGAKALFARAFPQADWDRAYAVDHTLSRDRARAVLFAALTSSNRPQATEEGK